MEHFLLTPFGLLVASYLGMFAHFMKKNIKGETPTDILHYFKDHFKSTLYAVIVTGIASIGYHQSLATNTPADIVSAFMIGYMFDSMINKWESTPKDA